jgi:ribose transport system substrate-binding protein
MARSAHRAASVLAAGLLVVASLSACGEASSNGAAPATSARPAASASGSSVAGRSPDAALAAAYQGVTGTPPTTAAKPIAGKSVWVVSCGQQSATCAGPVAAAVDAASVAGWSAKVCDGHLNPQGWGTCIGQGITAKASGVIVIGVDCVTVQATLKQAKTAGIPVISVGGIDCDVTGGTSLYTASVQNLAGMSAQQWWEKMGALQADWIIGRTNGHAQVLSLEFADVVWGPWIQQGFTTALAACAGCKVVATLQVGNADVVAGQLNQKFSTALLQHPSVNAVNVAIDGWFFLGLAQAIQSSGRANQLAVIGNFGEPGNLAFIRQGLGQDATVGFSAAWGAWAGVDALVRHFDNLPILPAGVGMQVIDSGHHMPAAGATFAYDPVIQYAAAYRKAWGRP